MILVDATPLQSEHRYRGPGVYTEGLLTAMIENELLDDLSLLVQRPSTSDASTLQPLLSSPGVGQTRLHRPRWPKYRLRYQLSARSVFSAVRRARPRLFHATDPAGLVRVPGIPVVATLYDLIPLHALDMHYPLRRLDQRFGYSRFVSLLRDVDHLIAISEATKIDAVERLRLPPEKISVTPLAVDDDVFYPRSRGEIGLVARRYNLRQPYFLHVGASNVHKNTAAVVEAFSLFLEENESDHALYIVGKWTPGAQNDLASTYSSLVENGRVRVLGYVPETDLPALYSGAEALVYPSLLEGFGLPVLEAMRCAAPVITSETSSLPEVGGDAVLYVDPGDIDSIAEAMAEIAGSAGVRAMLTARGQERAARFTWHRTALETVALYREFL